MKIKITKSVQYYFEEGDVIDTYSDEHCEKLIKAGLAISLEEKPKAIVGNTENKDIEEETKEPAPKKQPKKAKKK